MGLWKSERGINCGSWVAEMGRCMENLSKDIVASNNTHGEDEVPHEITMAEFADLLEFCSRGHLIVEVRYPEDAILPLSGRPLSKLHDEGVETYANRGQIQF